MHNKYRKWRIHNDFLFNLEFQYAFKIMCEFNCYNKNLRNLIFYSCFNNNKIIITQKTSEIIFDSNLDNQISLVNQMFGKCLKFLILLAEYIQ